MAQMRPRTAAQTAPYEYQILEGVGASNTQVVAQAANKIPSSLFGTLASGQTPVQNGFYYNAPFAFYGDDAAVLQKESDGVTYLYILKKGGTWSAATKTKISIGSNDELPLKAYMEENTIYVFAKGNIYIYEKSGSTWNTTRKGISSPMEELILAI